MVTHDQQEAMTMSEKIFVMDDGGIEQEGSSSEIYRQPNTTFVTGFIQMIDISPTKVINTSYLLIGGIYVC